MSRIEPWRAAHLQLFYFAGRFLSTALMPALLSFIPLSLRDTRRRMNDPMFADLNMLMDIFIERRPLYSEFVIKTHPHQLSAVQSFIEQYTKGHPSVGIAAKGTPYLIKGEYEIHIRPSKAIDHATTVTRDNKRAAA
jgi:hypothetical protein